jgi:hypothetical protein
MAQITDYTTLAAAIDDWEERDLDADELIGLAEAEFRIHLGPHYARETSATVTFTSGSASLPTGFVRPVAMTHTTYGEIDLVTLAQVRKRRLYSTGIPSVYAVTGSTLEVGPSYDGDLTFDYEAKLTGLSGSNATNWLITNAPHVYLDMCRFYAKSKFEDPAAPVFRAAALANLDMLVEQSTVAKYGQAGAVLRGCTP